jgi:PLP dependent protein
VPRVRIARVPAETTTISANLERLRERIERATARAWRQPEEITIVAVTKTVPPEAIKAAYELGLRHFAENRVQEFEAKRPRLLNLQAAWHLIGHLQRNKARRAVHLFHRIDGVDSLTLAQTLESEALAQEKRVPVLIEVRLSDEPNKTGISAANLPALAETVAPFSSLRLRGLMVVPPYFEDPEKTRPYFRKLHNLKDELSQRLGVPLPVLSMGMSRDFEIAIEEGATEIRVGTALFGERPRTKE